MLEGLYIASSGAVKQQRKMEVLSNNLANLSTPGFKKEQLIFQELIPGINANRPLEEARNTLLPVDKSNQGSSYVGMAGSSIQMAQGNLLKTGNDLDLALDGEGFFVVETQQGIRYTRKGSFKLDPDGQVITQNGNPVLTDQGEPLAVPPGSGFITVDGEGTVSAGSGTNIFPAGNLKVVSFPDKAILVKEGNGLMRMTSPNVKSFKPEKTRIIQGFVESSNVNVVEEMTKMIETHRMFEAYQKLIQSIDEADGQSVNTIARVA